MARLYLLGGEDVSKREAQEINFRAFCDAGGSPEVLVFSWAKASFEKDYESKRRLLAYFLALGASGVDFADYSDSFEDIAMQMKSSDLIYLTGGVTSALLERMRHKSVDRLLREYDEVIVGRSAGAAALGSRCIVTTRRNKKRINVVIPGFGLVDFAVKAHYKFSRDAQLSLLSKEGRIFGIPEGSALVYDSRVLSSIGYVYLFQNGEKTRFA